MAAKQPAEKMAIFIKTLDQVLNPHFVAGEHGLFGGHKSEDIWTFFGTVLLLAYTRL